MKFLQCRIYNPPRIFLLCNLFSFVKYENRKFHRITNRKQNEMVFYEQLCQNTTTLLETNFFVNIEILFNYFKM